MITNTCRITRLCLQHILFPLLLLSGASNSFAQQDVAPLPSLQNQESGISRGAIQGIVFTDPASGGVLTVSAHLDRVPVTISVPTLPGESPESVALKLQEASDASTDFSKRTGGIRAEATGIIGVGGQNSGMYCVAGTDNGLGIPSPVKNLTISYSQDTDILKLSWKNPDDTPLDSLAVIVNANGIGRVEGTQESLEFRSVSVLMARTFESVDDLSATVVGYVDFCPSAAAYTRLTPCRLEELADLPFRLGITPNWSGWQAPETGNLVFEEGHKQFFAGVAPETLDTRQQQMQRGDSYWFDKPEEKRLYQILRATGGDSSGGLYRYFLGLQPGHAYRVRMRVNTLDQRADTGQWSYSLYALPVSSSAGDPSPAQLAGAAPFASGAMAGQAALFTRLGSGGGGDTQGEWRYVATDGDGPGATGRGNIVLPAGADSILVWAAYTSDAPGAVGFDWIALEDADCMEALR